MADEETAIAQAAEAAGNAYFAALDELGVGGPAVIIVHASARDTAPNVVTVALGRDTDGYDVSRMIGELATEGIKAVADAGANVTVVDLKPPPSDPSSN